MWKFGIMILCLFLFSIYDIRSQKIPTALLAISGLCVLIAESCLLYKGQTHIASYGIAVLPGAILILTAYLTGKIGYGDGLVMLILGIAAGYKKSLVIFMISLMLAAILSALLLLLRKADRNTRIPFVPFITAAVLASYFIS